MKAPSLGKPGLSARPMEPARRGHRKPRETVPAVALSRLSYQPASGCCFVLFSAGLQHQTAVSPVGSLHWATLWFVVTTQSEGAEGWAGAAPSLLPQRSGSGRSPHAGTRLGLAFPSWQPGERPAAGQGNLWEGELLPGHAELPLQSQLSGARDIPGRWSSVTHS